MRDFFLININMNKIIDSHCHPYLNKQKDTDEVIVNFFENWGDKMIVIWTDLNTSETSLKLSKKYPWVYSTIWIHPCDIDDLDLENTILKLENLLLQNRNNIVWIWECWLDYYWLEKDEKINTLKWELRNKAINLKKKLQELFFRAQISIAEKYDLPIIIHNRDSKEDIYKILKDTWFKKFIFHCYSEDLEYANRLIELSPECKISFSWIVTFKNAKDIQETAEKIDKKHILAETDAPYLTPTPFRWKEENEPIYTKYIIEQIAYLRAENKDKTYEYIHNNTQSIFWLN